ncbi:MAG: protein kinase [Myxococcota bacterium]|nr:protein kinase [Myxococcota bacterium]
MTQARCPRCGRPMESEAFWCDECGIRLRRAPPIAPTRPEDGIAHSLDLPAEGMMLGGYRIEEVIGEGGMATVFRARRVRTGEEFALKVLASNFARNDKLVRRFRQEARIQKELLHPGIVRVFEVVEQGLTIALVMELVEGQSLERWLEEVGGPAGMQSCCAILTPVLQTLAYAHDARIIHRDLKPSNVLLKPSVYDPRVLWPKITDFGVAKILADSGMRTATGVALGTPHYMAPEQCRGARDIDHRADLYSVGVILFQMGTGAVPFPGNSDFDIMEGHARRAPPQPSVLNPDVPAALEDVILRAIEKDPAERFQSAQAFLEALQAAAIPAAAVDSHPGAVAPVVATAGRADGDSRAPGQTVTQSADLPGLPRGLGGKARDDGPSPPAEPGYVGFWARLLAHLLDTLLLAALTTPLLVSIYGWEYFGEDAPWLPRGWPDVVVSWILPAAAVILLWKVRQATPGKMAIGAVIVDAHTGGKPSTGQLVGRYLGYFLSALPCCLGFVWVAFDPRKQGWHDKLAGTLVVRAR